MWVRLIAAAGDCSAACDSEVQDVQDAGVSKLISLRAVTCLLLGKYNYDRPHHN
jgi:hypothetical protein